MRLSKLLYHLFLHSVLTKNTNYLKSSIANPEKCILIFWGTSGPGSRLRFLIMQSWFQFSKLTGSQSGSWSATLLTSKFFWSLSVFLSLIYKDCLLVKSKWKNITHILKSYNRIVDQHLWTVFFCSESKQIKNFGSPIWSHIHLNSPQRNYDKYELWIAITNIKYG